MDKWLQTKLPELDGEPVAPIHYYTREMSGYSAHIFIVFWSCEKELRNNWKSIDTSIAFNVQSTIEREIERSNFYICHILTTEITTILRREIEQDPFCAKKYIFVCDSFDLKYICSQIEKRIFNISLPKFAEENRYHVKKIGLSNFRGYKGEVEIDLCNQAGNPASFIVVYAPNGIGKTSLFDGIEYAIKGEVSYLKKIAKDQHFDKGPIYHNRENSKKQAYVKLILNHDKEILRNVRNLKEDGTDINIVPAKKGKDVVGTAKERTKWDRIILPHAKIDSFISARTPVDKYNEWFNNAPELKGERKIYEEQGKKVQDLEKELKKTRDNIETIESDIRKTDKDRQSYEKIKELISLFNELEQTYKLRAITDDFTIVEYDELINDVRRIKRDINDKIKDNEEIIQRIRSFKTRGYDECRKEYESLLQLRKSIEQLEKDLQDKETLSKLYGQYEELLQLHGEANKKYVQYKEILDLGKDDVIANAQNFARAMIEVERLEKYLSVIQIETSNIQEQINVLENKIKLDEETLNNKEVIKEVVISLETMQKEINDYKERIGKEKQQQKELEAELAKYHNEYKSLQETTIPEQLEAWGFEQLNTWEPIVGKDLVNDIENLRLQSNSVSEGISLLREQEAETDKLIIDIKNMGLRFQEIYQDNCECPLCHNKTSSWEELCSRISQINSDKKNNARLSSLVNKQSNLIAEYKIIQTQMKDKLLALCKEKRNHIYDLHENISKSQVELERDKDRLLRFQDEEEKLRQWLINRNLGNVSNLNMLCTFYSDLESTLASDRELVAQMRIQRERYDMAKSNACKEIETHKNIISDVHSDHNKYRLFNLLISIDFSFDNEFKVLEDKIGKYEKDLGDLAFEIKKFDRIRGIDISTIQQLIQANSKVVSERAEFINNFSIYADVSGESIDDKYDITISHQNELKDCRELLQQIEEENGAREFFSFYKAKIKLLEDEKRKASVYEGKIEKEITKRNKVQSELETKLGEYFSRSILNDIYKKIDPHESMKNLSYHLSFNDAQKGELFITSYSDESEHEDYRPEIYFSSAQLNTVAFSSFFSRALDSRENLKINTIFIDDPVGHFDDMNVLGFVDLMRSLLECSDCQIMMSTHDERVFRILQRKLDSDYYNACFINLLDDERVVWLS